MPSKQETVDYMLDQLKPAGDVTAKKMFGEYGLYCQGKMVGSICDDTLFIKPTAAGKAFAGEGFPEASPYPGARPALRIDAPKLADAAWISKLVQISAENLPAPKPKKPKKAK